MTPSHRREGLTRPGGRVGSLTAAFALASIAGGLGLPPAPHASTGPTPPENGAQKPSTLPFDASDPGLPSIHIRVLLDPERFTEQFEALDRRNYDIAGRDVKAGTVDLILNLAQLEEIRRVGYRFDWVARAGQPPFPATGYGPGEPIPEGSSLLAPLPDQRYHDYSELVAFMNQVEADHPGIAKKFDLGRSVQNRIIWGMKISDNPAVDEDETAILFNAQHHAREVMTPEVIMDTIDYLTDNYPSDPDVKRWVEGHEIWCIPTVNPDGSHIVFTNDYLWRKNARDNDNDGQLGSQDGVDLNRNYSWNWGGTCGGSTAQFSDQTYRGPSSGSEAETRVMMALADRRHFVFDVEYHSYGEDVFYAISCDPTENPTLSTISPPTPNQHISRIIAEEYAAAIVQADGGQGFSAAPYGGRVDGTGRDYQYWTHGTISFVTEINSSAEGGFFPDYGTTRDPTVQGQRPGWQYLLDRITGPSIGGHVRDAATGAPLQAEVRLDEMTLSRGEILYSDDLYGRYHLIVVPGSYTVRFRADGYEELALPVTVGGATAILEANLQPIGREIVWIDRLEPPLPGWATSEPGDTATAGHWVPGDPFLTRSGAYPVTPLIANPEFDTTVQSGRTAFVTGNATFPTPNDINADDVDGGRTTLRSPVVDLSSWYNLELSYFRRFHKTGSGAGDLLTVEISNDSGGTWTPVETLTATTASPRQSPAWLRRTALLDTLLKPTSGMRLRFVAQDLQGDDTIEAAVDDIVITGSNRLTQGLVRNLRVTGPASTIVTFDPVPGSPVYDVIRGNVTAVASAGGLVDLREVVCIENDSPDTSTSNTPDKTAPAAGESFFYLARFNLGFSTGSYGFSTAGQERVPASGGCAP